MTPLCACLQVLSNSAGGCVAAATAFGASLWSSHPMAATVQLVAWAAFLVRGVEGAQPL